ncbi:hypothetical protein, partial [Paralimibaculum aggregatum]|uniref:hypothetical protein n=1 Tax=Paralimibaculum aggregatum TaxID=3036245 RepID=UPI00255512E9
MRHAAGFAIALIAGILPLAGLAQDPVPDPAPGSASGSLWASVLPVQRPETLVAPAPAPENRAPEIGAARAWPGLAP